MRYKPERALTHCWLYWCVEMRYKHYVPDPGKNGTGITGAVVAEGGISRGRESLIACGEIKKHASCRSDYAKGTCNVKEKYYVIGNGIS